MILELLEYCLTPASGAARRLGYLRSSIAVRSRFSRCRRAWEGHLRHTREAILRGISSCVSRRTAVVLGAGLVNDIPLAELSAAFENVLLVDAVHTWGARWASRGFPNVRRVTADLTACAETLRGLRDSAIPLPAPFPTFFLEDTSVDLVLSVNVLSQLGWIPGRVLEGYRSEEEIRALQAHLVRAHLEYLKRLPGRVVLVSDQAWSRYPASEPRGAPASSWSVVQDVPLPEPDQSWDWEIAPAPEKEVGVDWVAHVVCFGDWKRSSEGHCWMAR